MKPQNTSIDISKLVLHLLELDLKIHRLRQGLYELGFECGTYYTDLPHFAYELMNIPKERYEEADTLCQELVHSFSLPKLGDEVYLNTASMILLTHLNKRFGQ